MDLKEILEKHEKWLLDAPGGERAILPEADLRNCNWDKEKKGGRR